MYSQQSCGCNPFKKRYVIKPKGNTPTMMPYTLRVITYALRRLNTNPLDWIKKSTSQNLSIFWLGWQDSNLRMQQSKCCVLPLDDTPILNFKIKLRLFCFGGVFSGVDSRIRTDGLQCHKLAL